MDDKKQQPSPADATEKTVGVVVVDHGSRLAASNLWIHELAKLYLAESNYSIVEPAHMELAEPTIDQAVRRCVEQGAETIVLSPYFFFPGKHWKNDLPKIFKESLDSFDGVDGFVAAPLGLDAKIVQVLVSRIEHCSMRLRGESDGCQVCTDATGCQYLSSN